MMRHLQEPPLWSRVVSGLETSLFSFAAIGVLSFTAIGVLGISSTGVVFAQDQTRQFSMKTAEIINEPIELYAAGQREAALKKLETTIENPSLNAFERSTIYQILGQYSYELDRPREAQRYFEQAIEAGGLLGKESDNIKLVIAQLMIGNGQYREGARRLESYINSRDDINDSNIELLVNACIQAEDYQCTLPWAEKWFAAASPKERRHYDVMNFIYGNLNMWDRQTDIIKKMIKLWPEDQVLWEAWGVVLEDTGKDEEAFEVSKIRYLSGALLKERDLLRLVDDYSKYDLPYQAAEILEREIAAKRIAKTPERLKQLGILFIEAREFDRAVSPLEAATKHAGDMELHLALGEALSNIGFCQKAKTAFESAIKGGYDAGKANMFVGNCYYAQTVNLDRLSCNMSDAQMRAAPIMKAREAALAAYKAVPQAGAENKPALDWIRFIEGEIRNFEDRCGFQSDGTGHCFQKIKQAYAAEIFTDGFKLEDESCHQYKAEYDKKFTVLRSK